MAMTRSTFAGFTTAYMGLAASQRALDVTGQNIANINKDGYTRQRLDLASISPTGHGYFQTQTDCRVGQGVEMTGVIRIRDPYIDVQYRTQLAKVGSIDAQDAMLEKVGKIFDEVDKTAVRDAMNNVVTQLETMSQTSNSNQGASDTAVRSSMEVLLNVIHENAKKVQEVQDDLVGELQKTTIPDMNKLLEKFKVLNESIKNTQILGGGALELQDQRDALIDELATYLPIDVAYKDLQLGAGIKVDTLQVSFTDTEGNKYVLIDDVNVGEFDMEPKDPSKTVPIEISIKPVAFQPKGGSLISNPNPAPAPLPTGATEYDEYKDAVAAGATDLYFKNPATFKIAGNTGKTGKDDPKHFDYFGEGVLKGKVDAINDSGFFDHPASTTKGVGYYRQMFDSFVNQFATTLNQMNIAAGGKALFTDSKGNVPENGFTADNIRVSDQWMLGNTRIMTKLDMSDTDTGNDNVLAMINAMTSKIYDFNNASGDTVFRGNLFDAYDSLQGTQSIERKASQSILQTRMSVLNDVSDSKDSVSGVWMDEEVSNLMRFQQSYNAAARLMTTLDEVLDTLITSTGRVGR